MFFDTAINENASSKYTAYVLKSIHYSKVIKRIKNEADGGILRCI